MYDQDMSVSGTLIWYYTICPRQVWLMSRQLNPDEDDQNLEYGRFLHKMSYKKEKKELRVGSNVMDFVDMVGGVPIVIEVKKSSRALESARLQLAHYLLTLEEIGIEVKGQLRFPEERRREDVVLNDALRLQVLAARKAVKGIMGQDLPPRATWSKWCRNCAYVSFCWA